MPQEKPREAFHLWIFLSNKKQLCAPFPTLQCQGAEASLSTHRGWKVEPEPQCVWEGLSLFLAPVGIRKLKVFALNSVRAANKSFDFW